MTIEIAVMILAAGASQRMGSPKALLPWSGGSVLDHILKQVMDAGYHKIVLVTGAHHEAILQQTNSGAVKSCYNQEWDQGIGSSIRKGIRFARQEFRDLSAILILLADQPLVSSDYLREMTSIFTEGSYPLVASNYPEGPGVPAIFGASHFDDLEALTKNKGAKSLLTRNSNSLKLLDPGHACMDMDNPEAYRKLRRIAGLPENPIDGTHTTNESHA